MTCTQANKRFLFFWANMLPAAFGQKKQMSVIRLAGMATQTSPTDDQETRPENTTLSYDPSQVWGIFSMGNANTTDMLREREWHCRNES